MIDTSNFKGDKGKATEKDKEAFNLLASSLEMANSLDSPRSLFVEKYDKLKTAKFTISHLSAHDLLRRDYKQYSSEHGWHYGLSSVPMSLAAWSERDGWEGIVKAMKGWAEEKSLDAVGILTSFVRETKKGNVKGRREVLLYYVQPIMASISSTLEKNASETVDLEPWKSDKPAPDFSQEFQAEVVIWTQGQS